MEEIGADYNTDAETFVKTFEQITEHTRNLQGAMDSISKAIKAVAIAVDENADVKKVVEVMDTNKDIVQNVNVEVNKFII